MPYVTSSGTKFGISTTVPPVSADTLTELAALTYDNVGGIMTLGTFGDTRNLVNFAVLGDGRQRKLAGAADAGTLNIEVAFDSYDAGQQAMLDAYTDGQEYAFKVETRDGVTPDPNSMFYFRGPVTSKAVNVNNNDSVLSRTFVVSVNSEVFESLAGAGP